jgi:uncharacterized membrane protein
MDDSKDPRVKPESAEGGRDTPSDPYPFDARSRFEDSVAWGITSRREYRWPAAAAVGVAILLQIAIPERLDHNLGPRWLIPVLEGVLLAALMAAKPKRVDEEERVLRALSLGLIAVITFANFLALSELIRALLGNSGPQGRVLVYASVPIWLTNVIVFALWYWELDRGGVSARLSKTHRRPDFLFPQMTVPGVDHDWAPGFLDYLYTAFTNATAFSPTDTMPLTSWAKLLMMIQSMASLLTVALVVSRAVNILQ